MVIYKHVPYVRIVFYLFTILFHAFLLVRALIDTRYLMAAVLLIPVTAISAGLWRFVGQGVTQIRLCDAKVEIRTLLRIFTFNTSEIKLKGRVIEAPGQKFSINRFKVKGLRRQMGLIEEL